jgi:hypothetical protein
MSDQPVTPDRDALIRAGTLALVSVTRLPEWMQVPALGRHMTPVAELVVDALLPLLAEALSRARQQGKREGREEVAEAIRDDRERAEHFGGLRTSLAVYDHCYELATGEMQPQPRLARGGPNRKAADGG